MDDLGDDRLLRYSRQILLPRIGVEGQQRICDSRVLVVGLGGLGSPAALYLAAAGVGEMLLADFDRVDDSNLQRQLAHGEADVGEFKAISAARSLAAINSACRVQPLVERLDDEVLLQRVADVDLVLDCSDNFATRFAINRACVQTRTPLVSGAAIRFEGQLTAFSGSGPCYQCLYREDSSDDLDQTCADNGVLASLVGVIGSLQASEALKILGGFGTPLYGRLLIHDALQGSWREMRLKADPACPVCGPSSPAAN